MAAVLGMDILCDLPRDVDNMSDLHYSGSITQ